MTAFTHQTEQELNDWKLVLNSWVTYSDVAKTYIIKKTLGKGQRIEKQAILNFDAPMIWDSANKSSKPA